MPPGWRAPRATASTGSSVGLERYASHLPPLDRCAARISGAAHDDGRELGAAHNRASLAVRPDEMYQTTNFDYLLARRNATERQTIIDNKWEGLGSAT